MARKVIGDNNGAENMDELKEENQRLKAQIELLLKHVDPVTIYGDKIRAMAGVTLRQILAEGQGEDWFNYLMGLTLNDIIALVSGPREGQSSGGGKRRGRIPRAEQQYYTLLAISEGATNAKEIKQAYGEHINSSVWTEMAKAGLLKKEGEKGAATYTMTKTGQARFRELAKRLGS